MHPIRFTRRPLLAAVLACFVFSSAHADSSSTLEERMSYKDFTGLGLDKLTPEQLHGLNEWMRTHAAPGCAAPSPAATVTPSASAATVATSLAAAGNDHIASHIVGDFTGWQQGTILKLANGQRWEVRDDEPLYTSHEHQPQVTVEPSMLHGWTLSVEGHGEIAHVIPAGH